MVVQSGFDLNLTIIFYENKNLSDPLLHLVANVISKFEMHEDMLSPWMGEYDSDRCLGGVTFAQIVRDRGSIHRICSDR